MPARKKEPANYSAARSPASYWTPWQLDTMSTFENKPSHKVVWRKGGGGWLCKLQWFAEKHHSARIRRLSCEWDERACAAEARADFAKIYQEQMPINRVRQGERRGKRNAIEKIGAKGRSAILKSQAFSFSAWRQTEHVLNILWQVSLDAGFVTVLYSNLWKTVANSNLCYGWKLLKGFRSENSVCLFV